MKKVKYLLVSIIAAFMMGCSSGGGGGGSDSPQSPAENKDVGYNPNDRWPEKGDYSYNYEYSYMVTSV